jgi:hypothetical protein
MLTKSTLFARGLQSFGHLPPAGEIKRAIRSSAPDASGQQSPQLARNGPGHSELVDGEARLAAGKPAAIRNGFLRRQFFAGKA